MGVSKFTKHAKIIKFVYCIIYIVTSAFGVISVNKTILAECLPPNHANCNHAKCNHANLIMLGISKLIKHKKLASGTICCV